MELMDQPVTADKLLCMPRGRVRYELRHGELHTTSPAGSEHGAVIGALFLEVAAFVRQHHLGIVFGAETGFLLQRAPDTVLAPDIAYVRRERIPKEGLSQGYFVGAPDLAVEVTSPGETVSEVDEKVADWLKAGALAVWVVNPRWRSVTVYAGGGAIRLFTSEAMLDGGEILPGFSCRVGSLFTSRR